VPNEYQNILWYGRGPFENYNDRSTGAKIGIHKAEVNSVQIPYIEPQEYGSYSNVRWFEIKNENGNGVKISADKLVSFSAVPFHNLDRAKYNYQLLKDEFSRVQINYGITGVGDTPNPTMPIYRVYPQVYLNSFSIIPLVNTK
jgi:beta-galactosidase